MAWSTRELADLAGVTVNTVRHYHRIGLLTEPDRASNGYKKYQVDHLVRLLQIRRLRDLGVPLDLIEQVGPGGDTASEALEAVDADLAATIERLQRARGQIRAVLQGASMTDVPAGFEDVASRLSPAERALVLVEAQLYDEDAMADVRRMIESGPDAVDTEFAALTTEASESARADLAERYAAAFTTLFERYPWLEDPTQRLMKSPHVVRDTFVESVVTLFNPAQVDVLGRASVIARRARVASRAEHGNGGTLDR